ncbi:MAG: hypothetical protein V7K88_21260 [Nostoc sp.]
MKEIIVNKRALAQPAAGIACCGKVSAIALQTTSKIKRRSVAACR